MGSPACLCPSLLASVKSTRKSELMSFSFSKGKLTYTLKTELLGENVHVGYLGVTRADRYCLLLADFYVLTWCNGVSPFYILISYLQGNHHGVCANW